MAKNAYVVPLVVVTVCAIAGYIVYRKFPKRGGQNGTPASGGSIGGAVGGGTDPYYNQQPYQQPPFDLAGLIASLFKKSPSNSTPGAGTAPAQGLLKGTNLNAYNVLFDAQHNLNLDGSPISYGQYASTDTLATSGPLAKEISDGYFQPVATDTSAADKFNAWWDSFTGNPVNQPDTLPGQSIDGAQQASYNVPDYTQSGAYDGGNLGDYQSSSGAADYSGYSAGDYGGYAGGYGGGDAGNFDAGSYDYASMDGGGY